jgi:choline dehydrogenase-like flavoprotein
MLSVPHRAVLDAVARRVVPHAYDGTSAPVDVVARIEARLAHAPPERVRDLELALTVLGSRVAALLLSGMTAPFPRLSGERQDTLLARWSTSPISSVRAIYQGVRRLVVAVYYTTPESFQETGLLGPNHLRPPAFAWEGPVPGTALPNADEPVARRTTLGTGALAATPPLIATAPPPPIRPSLAEQVRPTADAIVIGSGAGGAVVAARLAEHGRDVLLLEEGSLVATDELTENEGDMTARLYAESGMRATDDLSIVLLQGAAVGGGTLVNWMITFRAPDFVLDEWVRRFGLSDFAPSEMAPVFDRVEREIHATPVPDDAHSIANRILLDGARRLGWRAGAGRINARGCVRAGFCGQGCRYGAKQSVDRVYVPRALAAGARLLPDTRVDRIEVVERDPAGTASTRGLRRTTPPLKRVHATVVDRLTRQPVGHVVAEAPVVVLAAGAVGTPVILQRSGFGGGGVGRYLRLHPTTAVAGEHREDVYAAAGIPQSAVCDEFIRRDDNGYGFWIECAPHHPGLAAVATGGFGAEHRDVMRRFRRTTNLIVLVRDGSDLEGSNGSVRVSRSGRPRIAYRLGARDRANLVAGVEAGARMLLAAGVSGVRTLHTVGGELRDDRDLAALRDRAWGPHDLTMFSAHVNGTCRLGTDARISGADPTGERHGVRGLYIADGSLLPTGLGVNPQATIMALATVIAKRMTEAGVV